MIKSCILPLKRKGVNQTLQCHCMTPSPHLYSSWCTLHFSFVSVIGSHFRWPLCALKYSMHSRRCSFGLFFFYDAGPQKTECSQLQTAITNASFKTLEFINMEAYRLFFSGYSKHSNTCFEHSGVAAITWMDFYFLTGRRWMDGWMSCFKVTFHSCDFTSGNIKTHQSLLSTFTTSQGLTSNDYSGELTWV